MKVFKICALLVVLGIVGCQSDDQVDLIDDNDITQGDKDCFDEVTYMVVRPIISSIEFTPNDGPWNWYVSGQDTVKQIQMERCQCEVTAKEDLENFQKYTNTLGVVNGIEWSWWYSTNPTTFECIED